MEDKPGLKTTEFLALAGVFAVCLFNEKLGIGLSPTEVKELLSVTVLAYIGGRSVKKGLKGIAWGSPKSPSVPNPERRDQTQ